MAVVFPKFPKLSPEVRLMIWEIAALHPRVVEILFFSSQSDPTTVGFWSLPALLSTCSESHKASLPIYQRSTLEVSGQWTYFNYERDILYFPDKYFGKIRGRPPYHQPTRDVPWDFRFFHSKCDTAHQVQNIAFSINPFKYNEDRLDYQTFCVRTLQEFFLRPSMIPTIKRSFPTIILIEDDPFVGHDRYRLRTCSSSEDSRNSQDWIWTWKESLESWENRG